MANRAEGKRTNSSRHNFSFVLSECKAALDQNPKFNWCAVKQQKTAEKPWTFCENRREKTSKNDRFTVELNSINFRKVPLNLWWRHPTKTQDMTIKIFRRGSARIGIVSVFIIVLICLYYISIGSSQGPKEIKRWVDCILSNMYYYTFYFYLLIQ